MLFDLRGRGRRRTVQVIYLFLAILMGGGLVLFGIGGNTSGGLFDAFSSNSDAPKSTTYTKQIKNVQKQLEVSPRNATAWARMAELRTAEGASRGGFDGSKDGLTEFQQASTAWKRYLALKPKQVNLSVARQMINVYGQSGLNDADAAVAAMDLVIDQTKPPQADLFQQYALLAYTAGQTRKGDLASQRAVDLSPASDRKTVKQSLAALKAQVQQQLAAQQSASTPTTSTPATTTPPATTSTGKTTPSKTTTSSGSTTTGK